MNLTKTDVENVHHINKEYRIKHPIEELRYKFDEDVQEPVYSNRVYLLLFRITEIIISILCLILTSPLLFVVAMVIKIESPGSIFYKQLRVGKGGNEFWIYKFRSMRIDAEKLGPKWASQDDVRITSVGRIIRKTRIDELPQLINIIKGDMTLIGPRPEREIFVQKFTQQYPDFAKRTLVKPGLTGWAQVNGGYELSPEEKLIKDLYYIDNRTPKLDFKIMLLTIKVVITGDGAR